MRVLGCFTVVLVPLLLAACATEPQPGDNVTISFIGLNDVHGQIGPDDATGGLVGVSAYIDALRAARKADGGGVVLLDAGDMWQGTLESNLNEGAAVVATYNALGVTAAAIGNHEFDFGPNGTNAIPVDDGDDPRGALKRRAQEANFPLLAANLIDTSTGQPVTWENVQPSYTIDIADVRVGIIGVVTANALVTTIAANTTGLQIAPLTDTIADHAKRLRADGATLVVVVAHAGGRCTEFSDPDDLSSCETDAEIMKVARGLEPGLVDLIIGGHHHNQIAHVVNGISITSNFSRASSFGRVDFVLSKERHTVIERKIFVPQGTTASSGDTYEGRELVPDPDVMRIAAQAEHAADELKNTSLGISLTAPFELVRDIESPLSNLMTAAMLDSFEADIAIHNVIGGIRAGLPAGELTFGDVYEMFPFDNFVMILEITGADLRRTIARLSKTHRRAGFSGMRVFAECNGTQLSIDMQLDDGRWIQDEDRMRVIANDFLALGGDSVLTPAIPEGGFILEFNQPRARDVLVEWFKAQGNALDPADWSSHKTPKWNPSEIIHQHCVL
jgi:5'-nucleotidase